MWKGRRRLLYQEPEPRVIPYISPWMPGFQGKEETLGYVMYTLLIKGN